MLLMILSPSDTTPSFGYKQNKLLAQPTYLPIRHKPASATKATKNSLKLRMANDIQSSTRYPESGCCSLPQQSIFQTPLTSTSTRQSTSPPTSTSTSPNLWLAAKISKEMCFCSSQRPRDASNGTSLGSRTPCGNGWRSCAATTLVCMQVIQNFKSPLDGLSSGCILLSRLKNFAGQRCSARVLRHRYR